MCTDVAELGHHRCGSRSANGRGARIDVIVNCAAYTDVERAEEDEPRADLLNHKAAGNLAAAAKATGATLFHVSTDYVFDGTAHTPSQGRIRLPRRWGRTGARNLQANAPSWRPGAGI
ncbi:MAG: sugar nucleotide-binding protein [Alistipes finegoldii]